MKSSLHLMCLQIQLALLYDMLQKSKLYELEWYFSGSWPGISLSESMILQGVEITELFYAKFGIWREYVNIITENGMTKNTFFRKSILDDLSKSLDKIMLEQPNMLLKSLNEYYPFFDDYVQQIQKIGDLSYKEMSSQKLSEVFLEMRSLQSQIIVYDQFGILSEKYFVQKAASILESRGESEEERFCYFTELTNPWTLSSLQKEELAIFSLIHKLWQDSKFLNSVSLNNRKAIRRRIIELAINDVESLEKNFGWIPVYLHSSSWNVDYYLRKLVEICLLNHGRDFVYIAAQTSSVTNLVEENKNRAIQKITQLKLDDNERICFDVLRLVMDTRNESAYSLGLASRTIKKIIAEILQRLNLSLELFSVLYPEEIASLLKDEITLKEIPTQSRMEICGYWFNENHELIQLDSKEAKDFFESRSLAKSNHQTNDRDLLPSKGICASLGIAKGVAKIVHNSEDFGKFNEGDVLVAKSTTVDFVPLMRIAAGIITEYGGITSHAAIISRELKKPAIVGYPGATKKFYDNQMLTFNAIEGTVETY